MKSMMKTFASAAIIAGLMGSTAFASGSATDEVVAPVQEEVIFAALKEKREIVKAERQATRDARKAEFKAAKDARKGELKAAKDARKVAKQEFVAGKREDVSAMRAEKVDERQARIEAKKAERQAKAEERALAVRAEFERKRDLKLAKLDDVYQTLEMKKLSTEDAVELAEIEAQQDRISKVSDQIKSIKGPKQPGL